MTKKTDRELQALLRRDFSAFIERVFYELNPGAMFLSHWTIDLIAAKLEACRRGEIKRLIINLPPRHLKSIAASVAWSTYILGHDPTAEILGVSYAQDLSEKFSRDARTIMSSAWYQRLFPTRLLANRQAANEFETTAHGFRKATSVGGVLTGRGADFIIIDDPLKPDDAMSETLRKSTNDWSSRTLIPRLTDKATGCIVLIMQRLHEDDLAGHLLAQDGWELLSLSAIAEEDEIHVIETPFGRERVTRKSGEALHPERESLATLDLVRASMGTANFSAQYLQAPTPPGGLLVKPEWFKRYKPEDLPRSFGQIVMSCDTANKVSELTDYSALTIWGVKDKQIYLLHVLRRRMEYPELKRTVIETAKQFGATVVLIEDRASGTQLAQELKADGLYSAQTCEPNGDKVMRFRAQTATIENGFVWLPQAAHWLDEYLKEVTSFPNGGHDDQVDSTAHALAWIKKPDPGAGWCAYYEGVWEEQQGIVRPKVHMLVPPGISHVLTLLGRQLPVPNDRVILVTEEEAQCLLGPGFKILD